MLSIGIPAPPPNSKGATNYYKAYRKEFERRRDNKLRAEIREKKLKQQLSDAKRKIKGLTKKLKMKHNRKK